MVSVSSVVMDLAVLTEEDPQMQENFPPNDEWTEWASFSEGSDSLENNGLSGFTRASRHSTPLSETDNVLCSPYIAKNTIQASNWAVKVCSRTG